MRTARWNGIAVGDQLEPVLHFFENVITRERRFEIRRTHVREHESITFLNRIPGLPVVLALLAPVRLARLIEALAVGAEQPSVIAASNPAILDLAVIQGGAAMTASRIDEAEL